MKTFLWGEMYPFLPPSPAPPPPPPLPLIPLTQSCHMSAFCPNTIWLAMLLKCHLPFSQFAISLRTFESPHHAPSFLPPTRVAFKGSNVILFLRNNRMNSLFLFIFVCFLLRTVFVGASQPIMQLKPHVPFVTDTFPCAVHVTYMCQLQLIYALKKMEAPVLRTVAMVLKF